MRVPAKFKRGIGTHNAMLIKLGVIGRYSVIQCWRCALQSLYTPRQAVQPTALHIGVQSLGIKPLTGEPFSEENIEIRGGLYYLLYFCSHVR